MQDWRVFSLSVCVSVCVVLQFEIASIRITEKLEEIKQGSTSMHLARLCFYWAQAHQVSFVNCNSSALWLISVYIYLYTIHRYLCVCVCVPWNFSTNSLYFSLQTFYVVFDRMCEAKWFHTIKAAHTHTHTLYKRLHKSVHLQWYHIEITEL